MFYTNSTTHIPSRVVLLPPPLLAPSAHWAAVQPSPDRTSVLLRSGHECQLLRLASSTAHTEPRTARRVVAPQPHRRLTASCWVSAGLREAEQGVLSTSAVVAVGDADSSLSVLRTTTAAAAAAAAPETESAAWTQSTIFLHDQHDRLISADGLRCSPVRNAVESILPCRHSTATDVHLLCQRRHDGAKYEWEGVGAATAQGRRHALWMAAVAKEQAWVVPLKMPKEAERETGGGSGAHHGLRLFDVRRRIPPPSAAESSGHHTAPSAAGVLAFAAVCDNHVGLFTSTTAEPIAYFHLPPCLSSHAVVGEWRVTAVLEAPPTAVSAQPFPAATSLVDNGSGSSHAYLVTASAVLHKGSAPTQLKEPQQRWWLLYDARKSAEPVWVAELPGQQPSMISGEVEGGSELHSNEKICSGDADAWFSGDTTEWLCCSSPVPGSSATPLRVCAAYRPPLHLCSRREAEEKASGDTSTGSVHILMDGAHDSTAAAPSPLSWALAPPPSLATAAQTTPSCRVRALCYHDHVLSYLCSREV